MEERIEMLRGLGFSEEQIQRIVAVFPNSVKLRPARLQASFDNLIELGFTQGEVITCINDTPSILGKGLNTVTNQVMLYQEIFGDRYKDIVLKSPRRMIQGEDKTSVRYETLRNHGITNIEQLEDVFLPEGQFQKKYR